MRSPGIVNLADRGRLFAAPLGLRDYLGMPAAPTRLSRGLLASGAAACGNPNGSLGNGWFLSRLVPFKVGPAVRIRFAPALSHGRTDFFDHGADKPRQPGRRSPGTLECGCRGTGP